VKSDNGKKVPILMTSDYLVERDAATFFHQSGSTPCLASVRRVEGIWIEVGDGRRLMDLHGNTVHHLGHAHPALIAALKAQLDELVFAPRRYTCSPAVELAERLLSHWPGAPARVLFATGGSDAIEIALKLARVATGRSETISLDTSYHGHGLGAYGLSGASLDPRLGRFLPGRHHVTPYWRNDLGGAERMVEEIEAILSKRGKDIAALIAEPIRSNCHVPPDWLWPRVRGLCSGVGVKLVFDEIPSGLGKTGRFFAFEHFGAVPDMVVLGKALGGGLLPISAVIADAALNVAPELDIGHYTHEKNPLTTRVALTTIETIEREGLVERAAERGRYARARIAEIAGTGGPIIGVRGLGLLLAVELDPHLMQGERSIADEMVMTCFRHGVSMTAKGPAAIGFSPPLTVSEQDLDFAMACIAEAAQHLGR
jgi:4-aminobutyrate aminotransferase